MFTVTTEKVLRIPGHEAWDVINDFGSHHRFNPFIERSSITNDMPVGEGVERILHLYDGSVMRQRIVDYQPPTGMVIEVIESTQLVRHHLIEITVAPESADTCRLAYRVSFRVPFGWLGYPVGLFHSVVMRSRYGHVLRGIERYVLEGRG